MAVAVPYLVQAAFAFVIGKLAGALLEKKQRPNIDGKKPTLSMRGSYVPILIGRRQVSPIVLWAGDRTVTSEGNAGGKGVTGSGGSQNVYRESAFHAISLGPGRKLYRILESDKVIWDGGSAGISAESHPSGSTITVSGHGSFRIYWGERDQPVNTFLGGTSTTPRIGYSGRHPFLFYVLWVRKRLGGSAVWPQLEYDAEVHPYKVGDTFAYEGSYDGLLGLPDRLAGSVGWFRNGLGNLGSLKPILTAVDGDPGTVKLQGNVTYPYPDKMRIIGNSAIADGDYDLDSLVYNAAEVLRAPTGVYIDVVGGSAFFTAWNQVGTITSVTTDSSAALPPNAVPFGGNASVVHKINMPFPSSGVRELSYAVAGAGYEKLSPGVNLIRFWVRGFNHIAQFRYVTAALQAYGHPTLADNEHSVTFVKSISGDPSVVVVNGAYGTIENVGQLTPGGGGAQDWWKIEMYYRSGTGTSPSDQNWKRRLVMRFNIDDNSGLWIYANHPYTTAHGSIIAPNDAVLSQDDGTNITGITTALTTQPLLGANITAGDVQFLRLGTGHDGANIGHTIDQLMFEPHPHGVGLPRSLFDIASLEEVAIQLGEDNEGLRTHVFIEDGTTLEESLGRIMLDIGLQIPWDPILGKYVFKLVRDPGADPITNIPQEMVHPPLPQITTILDAAVPDKKIYMFKDRDANYRDAPAPSIDDDGRASRSDRQNAKKEDLYIVTDLDAAAQVASRREQYETAPPSAYDIFVGRAARRLVPGIPLTVEGIDERLRLMEVGPLDQMSAKLKIKCLTDIYTAPPPTTDS